MKGDKELSGRSGTTLVELMIATLIGIIVFVSWLTLCNPKPVVKESYRREAVERASGYMDRMLMEKKSVGAYKITDTGASLTISTAEKGVTQSMFTNETAVVGYTMSVEKRRGGNWGTGDQQWAVMRLYDAAGIETNRVRPFFELESFYQ